jgi:putative aldouronate transport system substrate-binding protein
MNKNRILFVLLSLIVVLTMLAGCGQKATEAPAVEEPAVTEAPAAEEPVATEAPAAEEPEATEEAVVEEPVAETPVDIQWQFGLQTDQANPDEKAKVEEAVSKMLQAKGVNVNLKLLPYDWSEFDQKMQLQFQAGETCDIVFTAPWINNVYQHIANGDFLPLTQLLPEYAPDLWAQTAPAEWKVATVNNEIYSVLNRQIWTKVWGPYCRTDLLEKYPLDWSTITKTEDMIPWMDQVLAGEPDLVSIFDSTLVWTHEISGWDPVDDGIGGGSGSLVGVRYDDETAKVFNVLEQPEYLDVVNMKKLFHDKRYIVPEIVTSDETAARWNAGQYACGWHVYKPEMWGVKLNGGYVFDGKILVNPPIMTNAGPAATMSAVCKTSQHPELAVQVLNAVNTDPEIFNTIVYGVEGEHWVWKDEAKKLIGFPEGKATAAEVGWQAYNWMMGNTFNGYYIDPIWAENNVWKQTDDLNKSAAPSVMLGFTFNREPVTTELAQVAAVATELMPPIMDGLVDDPEAALADFNTKVKEAGLDVIIAELQKQIDAFLASQK